MDEWRIPSLKTSSSSFGRQAENEDDDLYRFWSKVFDVIYIEYILMSPSTGHTLMICDLIIRDITMDIITVRFVITEIY
jgi:hypothetical protein